MYDDEISPTLLGLFSRDTLLITGFSQPVIASIYPKNAYLHQNSNQQQFFDSIRPSEYFSLSLMITSDMVDAPRLVVTQQ